MVGSFQLGELKSFSQVGSTCWQMSKVVTSSSSSSSSPSSIPSLPSPLSSTPTHADQYQHHHHPRPLATHRHCHHLQVSGAFVTLRVFRVFRIFKFSRHSQVNFIITLFLYLIIIETSWKWKGLFSISFLSRVSEFSVTRCRYRDSHIRNKKF